MCICAAKTVGTARSGTPLNTCHGPGKETSLSFTVHAAATTRRKHSREPDVSNYYCYYYYYLIIIIFNFTKQTQTIRGKVIKRGLLFLIKNRTSGAFVLVSSLVLSCGWIFNMGSNITNCNAKRDSGPDLRRFGDVHPGAEAMAYARSAA